MVEERPKQRRKKGKARARKAQPKKVQPVLEEEQLPGLLEDEIPRGVPVAEEEAVAEEWPAVVAEKAVAEERPPVVAEKAAAEERPPVVAEKAAVPAEAVPARKPRSARGSQRRPVLAEKLMSVPEFRQRVVKLVVQKLS